METPFICASSTIASARGCSLGFSIAAAIDIISSTLNSLSYPKTSVTLGFPLVMVPVLSKTTVSISLADCRASPDLIRMPPLAPTPVPTIIATGVARPSAQGQEITSTAIALDMAASKPPPKIIHTTKVSSAIPITTGTKTPAILSASFAIGALDEDASSTRRIIWDKVVSSPTFTALHMRRPALFIVAETTGSPGCFSTGMLSPVIAASLMLDVPSTTTPSAGTRLPGFTTNKSSLIS